MPIEILYIDLTVRSITFGNRKILFKVNKTIKVDAKVIKAIGDQ